MTTLVAAPHYRGKHAPPPIPSLGRTCWTLLAAVGTARLGYFVVPFLSYWLVTDRALTATQTSLVLTAFGLGWAAATPLGGWLSDRYSRRHVIIVSAFGASAAYLALGLSHSLWSLTVFAALAGCMFDLYRPASQALITDTVPEQRRARALAALYLVMNTSRGVACIVGGALAESNFVALFVLNAAANAAFGIIAAAALPPDPARAPGQKSRWGEALADRRLIAFTAITAVFFTIHMQSMITIPVVAAELGATPALYGLILAADPAAVLIAQLAMQRRLEHQDPIRVCAIGIATVGTGLAITGIGTSVTWLILTTPIWVAGEVAFFAVAPAVVASLAPDHLRGTYFGIWGSAMGLSAVVAPLAAGAVTAMSGTAGLWTFCALGGLATAAGCLRLGGRLAPALNPLT
ncbi:MFS transporter [Catellatospora chokoriensis]|uniref:MFS transporter n=1 Tax=Catellatospora chokoriensis TaxID=310353 RepID=A0A8J3NRT0_9ACTN|nr:MFS transporter [Catellatospora chokoriensis]GIF89831.1 MFS transporter [Catellatospora chokoriensis]